MSNSILENKNHRFSADRMSALLIAIVIIMGCTASAQNTWIKKANFGGIARSGAVGFSIGNKGYAGTGFDQNQVYRKDFWQYNPANNTWTQKADFGGGERYDATGFSIGNKGYVGTGFGNVTYYNDFWEYNPLTNSWSQKASFGGNARRGATGFSIGTRGYIGTGIDANFNYKKDFWEYNPANDTWTQKADFGGTGRWGAVGFAIGNKGYAGTGLDLNFNHRNDFWEYKPGLNTWEQKADFGGNARLAAVGFSIGSKGYIGTGHTSQTYQKDFWEYDPSLDSWVEKLNFGGPQREEAVGFSIGNRGYLGMGFTFTNMSIYLKDFWQYTPDGILFSLKDSGGHSTLNSDNRSQEELTPTHMRLEGKTMMSEIYPNPVKDNLIINLASGNQIIVRVYDLQGRIIDLPINAENLKAQINVSALPDGYYLLQITNTETGGNEVYKFIKQ